MGDEASARDENSTMLLGGRCKHNDHRPEGSCVTLRKRTLSEKGLKPELLVVQM